MKVFIRTISNFSCIEEKYRIKAYLSSLNFYLLSGEDSLYVYAIRDNPSISYFGISIFVGIGLILGIVLIYGM